MLLLTIHDVRSTESICAIAAYFEPLLPTGVEGVLAEPVLLLALQAEGARG